MILPNGYLLEYDRIALNAIVVTFLEGQLTCLMCMAEFRVLVTIHNKSGTEVREGCTVNCPYCNAPILNLGTDNARTMLTRMRAKKGKRRCQKDK